MRDQPIQANLPLCNGAFHMGRVVAFEPDEQEVQGEGDEGARSESDETQEVPE